MDIFEILRGDHNDIRRLLNEVIHQTSAKMPAEKRQDRAQDWEDAFNDLKLSIVVHNRAEEATLYEFVRTHSNRPERAAGKKHEHIMVEELLEDLEEINPRDDSWDTKLALLKNQVESHQAEEETTTFGLVRSALDTQTNERLARQFTRYRDELIERAKAQSRVRTHINPAGLELQGQR